MFFFMKVNWSTANWLRLQAVFGAPLFLMSCLSNITFFTNADVGYIIFNKAVIEGILCNDLWNNYCMMISNIFEKFQWKFRWSIPFGLYTGYYVLWLSRLYGCIQIFQSTTA